MTTPLRNSVVIAIFSLLFIGFEAYADIAVARREAGCSGASANSARCRALESAWGNPASHGTCDQRRQAAQDCCQGWNPSALCMARLDAANQRNIAALRTEATANGRSPDSSGLYGTAGADQRLNAMGRDGAQAMEGLCRGMRAACQSACGGTSPGTAWAPGSALPTAATAGFSDEANKRICGDGLKSFADGFKGQAANFQTAMDADEEARRRAAAPGGPGGPGGNPGSGTQQPQSGQGQQGQGKGQGGSPMDQLMKALQSAMKQDDQKDQQQQQPPAVDCSNPAIVGGNCPPQQVAAQSDSWNKKAGEAEMKDPEEKADSGNFNVAGNEGGDPSFQGNGEKKFSTPPTVTPPGGGGGGGIPGGQGGPQAGGAAGGGGYAVSSKNLADVMHGTMSGGGYAAQAAAMNMQNGGGSGGYTYGQGGQDGMRGMDLRQFLPGGKSDPTRKLAGGNGLGIGGAGMQIQSQSVNIWNRITERIKSRCSQGLLRDCIP